MTVSSTSPNPASLRWVRAPRIPSASRTDGITINLVEGRWKLSRNGEVQVLATPPATFAFESALEEADVLYPPAPWRHERGVWIADLWHVVPDGAGAWAVYRNIDGLMERASLQIFVTADRARRWAELRFDRGTQGLRGPKPRAGSRAGSKLPDVRVTDEERDHAIAVLAERDLSYSEFVRAALAWVEEYVGEGLPWAVERNEDGSRSFVPSEP